MKNTLSIVTVLLAVLLFSNTQAFSQNMDSDKATLIVYRDGFLYGALTDFDVKVDGKKMGELKKNKSMHTYQLAAGQHSIAPGDADRSVGMNMSAGKNYIVEYKVRFGLLGAIPKLDIKTISQGKKDSKMVREYFNKEMM